MALKKKHIRTMVLSLCLSAACAQFIYGRGTGKTGEGVPDAAGITDEEKKLLIMAYGDGTAARAADGGELEERELELIEGYRFLKEKLKEKYPSYDISVIGCDPGALILSSGADVFYLDYEGRPKEERERSLLKASVYTDENEGKMVELDNFTGEIICRDFEALLYEKISSAVPECVEVFAKMPAMYPDDLREGTVTADMVMEGEADIMHLTSIYCEGTKEDAGRVSDAVKKCVVDLGVKGSFEVVVTDDDTDMAQTARSGFTVGPDEGGGMQ